MQKKKIQSYFKAKKLYDNGEVDTVNDAVKAAKITLATFYKYKRMFGDNEPNEKGLVEIVPHVRETKTNNTRMEKELELIIKENSALREQILLRKELAQLVQ